MEKASYDIFYRLIACGLVLCIIAGFKYTGMFEVQRDALKTIISKNIDFTPKKLTSPAQGIVTAEFGGKHKGIDIANHEGAAVNSIDGGTVSEASQNESYGKYIKIKHEDFVSLYAHLSEITVKKDDKISKNQQIGKMGSTGDSTGPHLHFEIIKNNKYINPKSMVNIP